MRNGHSVDSDANGSQPLSACFLVCLENCLMVVHVGDNSVGSIRPFNQSLNGILRGFHGVSLQM